MKRKERIITERLILRTMLPSDVTRQYVSGLNDPEVNKYLVTVRACRQTLAVVKGFVESNLKSPIDILLGVFTKDTNLLIGTIRVNNISRFHMLCAIGICIFDKECWGRGYAKEALHAAVQYVFDVLGLHYIEAGVYAGNIASLKLFRGAGFRLDARLSNKYRHMDKFEEVLLFGKKNPRFNTRTLK